MIINNIANCVEYSTEQFRGKKEYHTLLTPKYWIFMTVEEVFQDIEDKLNRSIKQSKKENHEPRNVRELSEGFGRLQSKV